MECRPLRDNFSKYKYKLPTGGAKNNFQTFVVELLNCGTMFILATNNEVLDLLHFKKLTAFDANYSAAAHWIYLISPSYSAHVAHFGFYKNCWKC